MHTLFCKLSWVMMIYKLIFLDAIMSVSIVLCVDMSHQWGGWEQRDMRPNLVLFVWTNSLLKTQFYLECEEIEVNDISVVFQFW